MEEDARAYDELSRPQTENGCKFIGKLNVSLGHKVLDMGCGTGSVTKYIANIVGPDGHVVGIDPDAARIQIAQEKYKEISNLQFHVGSSANGFPHDNEPYYDAHVSTMAFHWLSNDEKKIYIQRAHRCLKSGGKFAISCLEKFGDHNLSADVCPLTQDGYRKLFQEVSLFPNVVVEKVFHTFQFKSFEEYKRWLKATTRCDLEELDQDWVKMAMHDYLTINDDGVVTISNSPEVNITATKI